MSNSRSEGRLIDLAQQDPVSYVGIIAQEIGQIDSRIISMPRGKGRPRWSENLLRQEDLNEAKARKVLDLLALRGDPRLTFSLTTQETPQEQPTRFSQNKVSLEIRGAQGLVLADVNTRLKDLLIATDMQDKIDDFRDTFLVPYSSTPEGALAHTHRLHKELTQMGVEEAIKTRWGDSIGIDEILKLKVLAGKNILREAANWPDFADFLGAEKFMDADKGIRVALVFPENGEGQRIRLPWDSEFDSLVQSALGGYIRIDSAVIQGSEAKQNLLLSMS